MLYRILVYIVNSIISDTQLFCPLVTSPTGVARLKNKALNLRHGGAFT